jgi:NAD(P)-dependent dehydrogenase (short-subunit alcohol dehydrogenase family)
MTSLKDRVAIVTGASGGFGRAIALKLAQSEAAVALVDLRAPIETATMAGSSAIAFAGDVSVDATRARLGEEIDRTFGRADIVVNNAAVFPRGSIDDVDFDAWRRAFAVNLDAHFHIAKHFVPRMRKNGYGRFIAISSNSIGTPEQGLSA